MTRPDREGFTARKATNLSLDSDLVEEAKALGINLSRACETALRQEIAAERGRRWKVDNSDAIEAWNAYHQEHDSPLDGYRPF